MTPRRLAGRGKYFVSGLSQCILFGILYRRVQLYFNHSTRNYIRIYVNTRHNNNSNYII